MRLRSLCLTTVVLGSCFCLPHASAGGPQLQYDGIYYRTGGDSVNQHFRFYRDGTVISVATPAAMTPGIAGWFYRGRPSVAQGRSSVKSGSLQMVIKPDAIPESILPEAFRGKIPKTIHYSGLIGRGYIALHRDGDPAQKRHEFVQVRFANCGTTGNGPTIEKSG